MFVHQMKSGELIDLWVSLEELTRWSRALMARGVSAGHLVEGCPGINFTIYLGQVSALCMNLSEQ